MTTKKRVKPPDRCLDAARRFVEAARADGLDVRLSDDLWRVQLFSTRTKRLLASSPVEEFAL